MNSKKIINLSTNICGIELKNPVIAASGTFGFGREFSEYIDLNLLGGISVKGITLESRMGNKPPRIAETPSGIINSVGLQNPGIDRFIDEEIPFLRNYDVAIIVNIAGNRVEDYEKLAEKLSSCDVDALEINVSCPNVCNGISFGNNRKGISEVVRAVKKYAKHPVIVKLTPNVSDIKEIAMAAEESGADAISLINTILAMAIDLKSRKPILKNNFGGLSGPCVKPIALRMTYEVANVVKVPVIGMGGIVTGEDALEFLLAGAKAVMVGTSNFIDPTATIDVIEGIKVFMQENNFSCIDDIIGKLELN